MKLVNGSLAALVAVALSGCVNIGVPLQEYAGALDQSQSAKQSLAAVQSCCASLAELKYQPLPEGSSVLTIDGASQAFRFEEGMSYLGAYRLPENTGDLIIKVAAQVGKSVLVPQVLMLDSNHEVTRVLGKSVFTYQPAHLMDNDRIEGTIYVSRNAVKQEAYMVIYTPAAELSGATTVLHPAKAFARANGNQEPDIPDPVIPHSAWGVLAVDVKDRAKEQGLDNVFKTEYSDKIALSQGVQPSVTTTAAVASGTTVAAATRPQPAPAMLSETETFYQAQIEKAVQDGNIEKAMKLVEEAQRAGSTRAKQTFVDAIKRSQK
ncbi:MalM family protein [Aeromonas simiae]|uniref:Transcriptional regulator n=1 Tax=Aeromonas simiae TaxID=218936 RepID=A0A5J6WZH9_9GAMM|nr:MalM family protein [Aeromonas simiae]QFI55298.1 transcriptional regulator [Aeromonas simiae]